MTIDILNLQPQKISRSLKGKYVFAYGPEKIGKTSLIASFPKSLVLCFEPGTNALDGIYAQPITTWGEFKMVLRQLERAEAKELYDFVGIDTIDIAFELCETYICKQFQVENISDVAWGKAHAALNKEFSKAFRQIAQLGYGLIFISHATEKTLKDYEGKEYNKIVPAAPTRAKDVANKLVDFIIYIGMEYSKDYPDGRRMMQLKGTKTVQAGSRFQYVPDKIEFGYENLRDTILNAIDKQVGGKTESITDEQSTFYKDDKGRPFEECFNEVKEVWAEILTKDESDPTLDRLNKIIEQNFNRKIKLSSVTEDQQELLELTLIDLKDFLATL